MLWIVIGVMAIYILGREGYLAIKKPDGTDVIVTPAPKSGALDPITTIATNLQAWLKGLGIVQDMAELHGRVEEIAAYAAIVLVEPHVLDVVDSAQQAAVGKAFVDIKTAISQVTPTTGK